MPWSRCQSGVGSQVELDDLRGVSQPNCFCDPVALEGEGCEESGAVGRGAVSPRRPCRCHPQCQGRDGRRQYRAPPAGGSASPRSGAPAGRPFPAPQRSLPRHRGSGTGPWTRRSHAHSRDRRARLSSQLNGEHCCHAELDVALSVISDLDFSPEPLACRNLIFKAGSVISRVCLPSLSN